MIYKFATNRHSILAPPEGCEVFGVLHLEHDPYAVIAEVLLDLDTGELFLDTFWGPPVDNGQYKAAADHRIATVFSAVFGQTWKNEVQALDPRFAPDPHAGGSYQVGARDRLLKAAREIVLADLATDRLADMLRARLIPSDLDPDESVRVRHAISFLCATHT